MKKTILIMDQDFTFLNLYNHIIPKERFYIMKCSDLAHILSFIMSIRIDLIICDADKPNGCGIELLKILRENECVLPVIIVSGAFYPSDTRISEDAYAFLPKSQILETLPKLIAADSKIWDYKKKYAQIIK